jgi:photosystem II stability/assembly factor-like uncharacterized protein
MKKLISIIACLILLISTDTLGQWEEVNNGIDLGEVKYIKAKGKLLITHIINKGVFVSTDTGNSWTKNVSLGRFANLSIVGNEIIIWDALNISVTNDDGITWNTLNSDQFLIPNWSLRNVTKTKDNLYGIFLYSYKDLGVYHFGKTSDYGKTWTNLDDYNNEIRFLNSIGNNVYASTKRDVYLSKDDGENWVKTYSVDDQYTIQNLEAIDNSIYIYGSYISRIYYSNNNEQKWKKAKFHDWIFSVEELEPYLFVGSLGVFVSQDTGQTWKNIYTNDNTFITSLKIQNGYIFAGTKQEGIYRAKLSDFGITDVKEDIKLSNSFTISPNPSQKNINIKFGNELNLDSKYFIFDLSGKIISENTIKSVTNTYSLRTENLSPGLYFIKINNEIRSFIKW